jgi:hypothetical protein
MQRIAGFGDLASDRCARRSGARRDDGTRLAIDLELHLGRAGGLVVV